jgi:hypothetical protein
MADDEPKPNEVMDAAHAAIGGVQAGLQNVEVRLDAILAAQAQTLEHLARIQPVSAVQAEIAGAQSAVDPEGHDPPAIAPNEPVHEASPLRKLHNVIG